MTDRPRLVIVGNGMAGIRALEEILARAPDRFAITVFGAEPHGNYNRIMLSPVLAGEKEFADIVTHDRGWYADQGVTLVAGEAAVEIDRTGQRVIGAAGTAAPYDTLLLATGSDPVMLPLPGSRLSGVVGFRGIADVHAMLAACRPDGAAVVIGGGLLGLEAAYGLSRRGMKVTVLHLLSTLMERQLDPVSAGMLARDLADRGITVITEASTKEILGTDHVTGVALADGRILPAGLVVMAVGIRPSTGLARAAGLAVNRGVVVDDAMRTDDPTILAVGECVEHRGALFGLVAPLWDMARVCAETICGSPAAYEPALSGTRLKVTGIDMFSAGDFSHGPEIITLSDPAAGRHRRLCLRGGWLAGVVLYGDATDAAWYFDLLGTDVSELRDTLIFGPVPELDGAEQNTPAALEAAA